MALKLKLLSCLLLALLEYCSAQTGPPYRQQRVTTILTAPYLSRKPNGQFEGFLKDILDEASRQSGFYFDIHEVADQQYGHFPDKDSLNSTGMIGELQRNEADIAVAALTRTHLRSKVVYFSHPFLKSGMRILIKIPPPWYSTETLFSLLLPLSSGVWLSLVCFGIAVMVAFCCLSRFSPWEATTRQGGLFTLDTTGTTLANSLLFVLGSCTWQGYTMIPRSVSGRILALSWWLFTAFFLLIYGANLTAFFITKEPEIQSIPFLSFEDMARQSDVEYGFLRFGAIPAHFRTSKGPVERLIWSKVTNRPDLLVNSHLEGVERVRSSQGKYAFILEGPHAEYIASKPPCDLMVVGETLAVDTAYAFACRDDAVCRALDVTLLDMRQKGTLLKSRRKWFGGQCVDEASDEYVYFGTEYMKKEKVKALSGHKAVTLKRFGPPLVFIGVGIGLSLLLLGVEILWARFYRAPTATKLTAECSSFSPVT